MIGQREVYIQITCSIGLGFAVGLDSLVFPVRIFP